jgi:hypothetical protein
MYKSIFQKIAVHIYPHIKTIVINHQYVLANQLQSEFIWIHTTHHQVINAQKL